jgi:hypothetical protein
MQTISTIIIAVSIISILGIVYVVNKKDEITSTEQQKEISNQYYCNECGCLLWGNMNEVKTHVPFGGMYSTNYCNTHKKPYSYIRQAGYLGIDNKDTYMAEFKVDKDGIPIGYKKIK